jgi:hypothetical protein
MAKSNIHWDEQNLQVNEEEAIAANRTKILEPKTPFHYLEEGDEPAAYPPKAAPARAAGPSDLAQLSQGGALDLAALAAKAAEQPRGEAPLGEDEIDSAFRDKRKAHYKTGSLAELRARAAALDEEEEDEDD